MSREANSKPLIVPDRTRTRQPVVPAPRGLLKGASPSRFREAREILAWLLFLLVMAAFTGLQIWFEQQFIRPLSMILVSISVLIELGVILKINRGLNY